jgi:DNA-binding Lrp family transcriptional regulator
MPGWKFLTNHAQVLCLLAKRPRITAREVSNIVGITEKATRNIINDLEYDGYIAKKKEGRGIFYRFDPNLPLRTETQQDKAIGDLLVVLGWKRRKKQAKKKAPAGQTSLFT